VVLHGLLVRRAHTLWVLIRDPKGEFKTQALLCTDLNADPQKILSWFVMRWQLEVTFQEMRRHLGFETQRQWSDMAIRRTTPALLSLFSLVTLFAHCNRRMREAAGAFRRQAACYHKSLPRPSPMRLRWCACAGAQGVVGTATFLWVACGDRDDKSPTGICGTTNRRGLLRSLTAKVELQALE
jgi:hypothetical protein